MNLKLRLLTLFSFLSIFSFCQLNGTYTIDAGQPLSVTNFQKFSQAVAQLNTVGVSGPVIFNAAAGTYSDSLYFNNITGASATNTILFQKDPSATAPVLITYANGNSTDGVIKLSSTKYLTFDGINFQATNATYGRMVYHTGTLNSINFFNCEFTGFNTSNVSTTNHAMFYGVTSNTQGTGFTLDNCITNNGSHVFYSAGATATPSTALTVTDCEFLDYTGYGFYVSQWNNVTINDMKMYGEATSSLAYGIYIFNGSTAPAVKLDVQRVDMKTKTASTWYGLYASYFNSTAGDPSIVANNMFTNYSPGATGSRYGLYLSTMNNINVFHNTVRISDGSTTASRALYLLNGTSTLFTPGNYNIRNNIFSNTVTGGASGHCVYVTTAAIPYVTGYSNNLYNPENASGYFWGVAQANFGAFTAASGELNAVEGDPQFFNATDAHVLGLLPNDAGLNLPSITVDIDGQTRPLAPSTTVDIGADEFAPPTCPQPVALTVISSDLVSGTIGWTSISATQWQIEYGIVGFTPGTGTLAIVNSNPTTISGLTQNSFYSVYVRSICTPGDTSFWSGPINFNTYDQPLFMDWSSECPTPGFIDISETGTDLNLTDDSEVGLVLPFPILMQGQLYTNVTVGNNGGLQLGTTAAQIAYGGVFTTMASGTIFPWGDDMDDETGNVYVEEIGTTPNRILVVQWDSSCNFSGSVGAPNVTFEVQFHEADMNIYFVYNDVVFGGANVADDYGANADLGLSGANQDFTISTNNATYLQNNSCVRFYYVDCPKITNLLVDYVQADEVSLSWTPSIANETNWTIIYGPSGFDPAVTGTIITVTSPTNQPISPLTQNTLYDFYVYADCSPTTQSVGVMTTINTLPFCSNPAGIVTSTAADSVFTAWNWTTYPGGAYPATGFNLQYGSLGFSNGSGTVISNADLTAPHNDTTFNAAFLAGGVYEIYVQAVCGNDTSSYVGPFTFTMPLTNDSICGAEALPVDGVARIFNNTGATAQPNENIIAPPSTGAQTTDGWINGNVNFTTWFSFVAPASGNVRVSGVDQGFNGQMAVYSASSCSPITSLVLEGANDNEIGGTSLAPNFTVCGLTPGVTYFLMHDSFSTTLTGQYSVKLSQISLDAGSTTTQINACLGDTVDLFTGIAGQQAGGTWLDTDGTFHIVGGTQFNTGGLANGVYDFEYRIEDGCAYDSAMASVKIYAPSYAGTGGTFTICKNEPTDLLQGLSGIVESGGTWTDPNSAALPNSVINWGTLFVPGNYNYTYTVGNGVCPDATAVVTVIVSANCDWLGLEDIIAENVSVSPNPSSDKVTIDFGTLTDSFDVVLMDMTGKEVFVGTKAKETTKFTIDLTNLEVGNYLLKVSNGQSANTMKIVKN